MTIKTRADELAELRAWQPGDGLHCSLSTRAAQGFPCGPPVITREHEVSASGRRTSRRTEVVCQNHLAARFIDGGLGKVNAGIECMAREAVLAAHWQEYLDEVARRRAAAVSGVFDAIPAELHPLVEIGLAQHIASITESVSSS